MDLIIEKAGPQDLDAVTELYGAVCDYLADKPYNPGWRRGGFPSREDAAQYLAADGLYVIRADGEIAGSIALTGSPSAEEVRPGEDGVLYLHVIAVHPKYLRRGAASAMLAFAARDAAARGARALRLYVWEHNAPAIRTYEKSGFVRQGREDIGLDWFYLYEKRVDR